jgi:hypothetical protein
MSTITIRIADSGTGERGQRLKAAERNREIISSNSTDIMEGDYPEINSYEECQFKDDCVIR